MIQDEFNNVKVSNDSELLKAEYGEVQASEFSESGEMHLHRTAYNANLNQTSKVTESSSAAEAESASTASVSGGASSASGASTTVAGNATATCIAAGSVSSVVVASSVAITAISVVTGVSVALHDYQCEVNSLFVSSNQLTYELVIDDLSLKEEEEYEHYKDEEPDHLEEQPCSIRVYNNYYDKTNKLYLGYNYDSFTDLTLGQTYNIVVKADDALGGKTLFEDVFTTTAVAKFTDFYIESDFDYYNNIAYVYLDYVDEIDQISDLKLSLTREEEFEFEEEELDSPHKDSFTVTYPLEKKVGMQEVHLSEQDVFIEKDIPYQYKFTYVRNKEEITFDEGYITFNSAFEGVSEINEVIFDKTANFINRSFNITLDYIDENDILFDFGLEFTRSDNIYTYISLEKTTEPQTIFADDYELSLEYEYTVNFCYSKHYNYETIPLGTFTFTDNSGGQSKFNSFIFDKKADFVDKKFIVQLDYVDDFNIYHNFVLNIKSKTSSIEEEYYLDESTEEQELGTYSLSFEEEYNYTLTCDRKGEATTLDSGSFTFIDSKGRSAEFNEFKFDKTGNFLTNKFDVQLDYTDTLNTFDNFVLSFTDTNSLAKYEFVLENKTTVQTLSGEEKGMVLMDHSYNYELTADKFDVNRTLTTGSVTFTDNSGAVSSFNGLTFDKKMDFKTGAFNVQLDYQDDFGFFSEFRLRFLNTELNVDTTITLEEKTTVQQFNGFDYGLTHDVEYTYILSYYSRDQLISLDPITFTFEDSEGRVSNFNQFIFSKQGNYLTNEFDVQLDYVDELDFYSDFVLTFYDVEDGQPYVFDLGEVTTVQTLEGDGPKMVLRNRSYNYELTCKKEGEPLTLETGSVTFTDTSGAISDFNEFIFDKTGNFLTNEFTVQLDYQDDFDIYSEFRLKFTETTTEEEHIIELAENTDPQPILGSEYGMFLRLESYDYELTCKVEGELTTLDSGSVTFTDTSGAKSEFKEFVFSKQGNFLTNEFDVQLDYQDDFDAYSDFVLTFTNSDGRDIVISLNKTTEVQTINGMENDMSLMYDEFDYVLTCTKDGEQVTLESGSVVFTDNSGAVSEFNEFIFDETANFLTNEFVVQLDYQDDFDFLSDFVLTLTNDGYEFEVDINLEKTTEQQTIDASIYDISFEIPYTYTLTCRNNGVSETLASKEFEFSDNSGAVSEFQGLSVVNGEANYKTRTFAVQLAYQDDFDRFDNFSLTIKDATTDNERVVALEKTTAPQEITIADSEWDSNQGRTVYPIDILSDEILFSLSYTDSRNGTVNPISEQPVTFTNSLHTTFTGIECSYELIYNDSIYGGYYTLPIKLVYNDEAGIYGAPMNINLIINDEIIGQLAFANEVIDPVGDWMYTDLSTELSIEEILNSTVTISVVCQIMDEITGENVVETDYEVYSEDVTFTVANESKIYAVLVEENIYGSTGYITPLYNGEGTDFTNCQLIIETASGETYTYNVDLSSGETSINVEFTEPNEGYLSTDELMEIFNEPVKVSFTYCVITGGSDAGPQEISEPITIVISDSYRFTVQV